MHYCLISVISGRAWYNDIHMHYTCARYMSTLMKTCHSHVSHAEGFGQMLEVFCGMSQHRCTSTEHAFSELHGKKSVFSKQYFIRLLHSFRTWIYHALTLRCPQEAWLVLLAVCISACSCLTPSHPVCLLHWWSAFSPSPPVTATSTNAWIWKNSEGSRDRETDAFLDNVSGEGEHWITTSSSTLTTL